LALCRIFYRQYPQPEHPSGVSSGVQPLSWLVRGPRPDARCDPTTRRRHLYRGAASRGIGTIGETTARGDPHAVQLAGHRSGCANQPGGRGTRPETGKTPVFEADAWRKLLKSIPTTTLRDLRDRALIAMLTYSFARLTAALKERGRHCRRPERLVVPDGTGSQQQSAF
jgi:hypothetical protein